MDWQPIETAPKDGTEILVWVPFDVEGGCYDLVRWNSDEKKWCEDDGSVIVPEFYRPSHWQQLEQPK